MNLRGHQHLELDVVETNERFQRRHSSTKYNAIIRSCNLYHPEIHFQTLQLGSAASVFRRPMDERRDEACVPRLIGSVLLFVSSLHEP